MDSRYNTNTTEAFGNEKECDSCLCYQQLPLFSHLTEDELAYLDSHRSEVVFKKGEIIAKQGMPCNYFIVLNKGLAKAYIEGPQDKNLIVSICQPFIPLAGPGMYADNKNHYSIQALTECVACSFDTAAIKSLIRQNPNFAEEFITGFSRRSILTFNMFITLTQKNMEGRVAEALLYVDGIFNHEPIHYLTKQDFAELTAMSKESVIRVMKEFKSEGLIEDNHQSIVLLDKDQIRKIAATA